MRPIWLGLLVVGGCGPSSKGGAGASPSSTATSATGPFYSYPGTTTSTTPTAPQLAPMFTVEVAYEYAVFSGTVADFDGDGQADLAVPVYTYLDENTYVFFGPLAAGTFTPADADLEITGGGYRLSAAGDADGIPGEELWVGRFLVSPRVAGVLDAGANHLVEVAEEPYQGLVSADFDADGNLDLFLAGKLWSDVLYGPLPQFVDWHSDAGPPLPGSYRLDYDCPEFPSRPTVVDLDVDGLPEVIFGNVSTEYQYYNYGCTSPEAPHFLAEIGDHRGIETTAQAAAESAGFGDLVSVGDGDGDGAADFLASDWQGGLGAPGVRSGADWVATGRVDGGSPILELQGDQGIVNGQLVGDLDGDGFADLLLDPEPGGVDLNIRYLSGADTVGVVGPQNAATLGAPAPDVGGQVVRDLDGDGVNDVSAGGNVWSGAAYLALAGN